jgi:hypothetical protein
MLLVILSLIYPATDRYSLETLLVSASLKMVSSFATS